MFCKHYERLVRGLGRGYCKFPTAAQRSATGGRETKTNRQLG